MNDKITKETTRGPSTRAISLMAAAAVSVTTVGILASHVGAQEPDNSITSAVVENIGAPTSTTDAEARFVSSKSNDNQKPLSRIIDTLTNSDDPWEDDCPGCGMG